MTTTVYANARVVTPPPGPTPRKGKAMGELLIYPNAHVYATDGVIDRIEPAALGKMPDADRVVDIAGNVLLPGLIDCHTHSCYAGSRIDEWEQKLAGRSYLEILKAGGGIMSTVRAVRAASANELQRHLESNVLLMTTRVGRKVIEVKSGYGLLVEHELKMLQAITGCNTFFDRLGASSGRDIQEYVCPVIATALLGHAIDPEIERTRFIDTVLHETLPAVSKAYPGITIDAFCEEGAWSLDECQELFLKAKSLGHPCRVHADQFHDLGMTPWACQQGFTSVDHLEACGERGVEALANSSTVGVVLPACGFHLDGRYANARRLIDAGAAVALATNDNPGSAPCKSLPFVMALAMRHCGMSREECITACTVNAAHVLGQADRGVIAPGMKASFTQLGTHDERELGYQFASDSLIKFIHVKDTKK